MQTVRQSIAVVTCYRRHFAFPLSTTLGAPQGRICASKS